MIPMYFADVSVCVNYELKDDDTFVGVFTCPMPLEPSTFTQCCGQQYAEYCCTPDAKVRHKIKGLSG